MKCKYQKGHTYEVEFAVAAPIIAKCTSVTALKSPEEGWLCGFEEQDTEYTFDMFVPVGRGSEWQKRQVDESGVPVAYAGQGMGAFKWELYQDQAKAVKLRAMVDAYRSSLDQMFVDGKGLYLYSNTRGSGKTKLACCLAFEAVQKKHSVCFLSSADFCEQIREKSNDFDKWSSVDLLIYDDLGAGGEDKDWPSRELFRLVDLRARRNKPIIWTSNMPIDKVQTDTRTLDRIYATSVFKLGMPEESIRRRLADDWNSEIVRRAAHGQIQQG